MTLFFIGSIVFVELLILYHITRTVQFYSPLIFFIVIPMLYADAFFLDYILSGFNVLSSYAMGMSLSIDDVDYFIVVLLTFMYILGIYMGVLMKMRKFNSLLYSSECWSHLFFSTKRYATPMWLSIIFCIIILMAVMFQVIGLERSSIKELSTPIRTIITQFAFIYLCFAFLYEKRHLSVNLIIFTVLLLYSILIFEREYVLILVYVMLLKVKADRLSIKHILFLSLLFFLLLYYKALITLFLLLYQGKDISLLLNQITTHPVIISYTDPAAGILMTADFINNVGMFSQYYGSYFVNTIIQFFRTFISMDWDSMGVFATNYYTEGEMGTGFSMIIESIINFGYIGPFIIGFFISYFFYKTESWSNIYYKMVYLIWFIFIVKVVRTEFAVVLKLYIFPSLIASFVFIKLLTSFQYTEKTPS